MDKLTMRAALKSFYDIQKIRIQVGNRIAGNARIKLGQEPGKKSDTLDAVALKLINRLVVAYRRLTDGLADPNTREKVKALEKSDGVITDLLEFELIGQYTHLLDQEVSFQKIIENQVKIFPIWDKFLKGVKGCGPLMAAVCISELDPAKAKYPSSFWKYAGLDVVVNEEGIGEGRSKKAHHLIDVQYTNKKGEEAMRKSITYSPFLKTKLIGVLGSSFIKHGGKYREIYDGYKHRLMCRPDLADAKKIKIHGMATRYMVKRFLADLWLDWREIEGLPTAEDYATAKLGYNHGKIA